MKQNSMIKRNETAAGFVRNLRPVRHGFAWPGGYPVALCLSDGETLCVGCAKAEAWKIFFGAREEGLFPGWEPAETENPFFILWEGPPAVCCHCNVEIPSAYGDPETSN